jgi:hypothetical protein
MNCQEIAVIVENFTINLLNTYRALERQQLRTENTEFSSRKTLGNPNCFYNARSIWLQCAVNPTGNCETCQHYQERNNND